MKKQISIILLLAVVLTAHATIRTVSNSPNNLAQFNTIQAAVDASVAGDTVYVHSSNTLYANVVLTKKIILLGAGWGPNTSPADFTWINQITLANSGNADGSEISGFKITGNIFFYKGRNDVRITRNRFEPGANIYFYYNDCAGGVQSNNILIEGNFFNSAGIYFHQACGAGPAFEIGITNSLIINNVIINGYYQSAIYNSNVTFQHNLIYGTSTFFSAGSKDAEMINNVLVNVNPTSINTNWINNITYNCAGTNTPWIGGTNSGTGNIANTNPNMVDQAAVDANTSNPLLNFTIPSGPANDAATDGKDLGLMYDLTGFLNWANSRNSKLPVVNNLLIISTAAPGGNLEIHLNATQAK